MRWIRSVSALRASLAGCLLLGAAGCTSGHTCPAPESVPAGREALAADIPASARLCNGSTLSFEGYDGNREAAHALQERLHERGWTGQLGADLRGDFVKGDERVHISFDEVSEGVTAGVMVYR